MAEGRCQGAGAWRSASTRPARSQLGVEFTAAGRPVPAEVAHRVLARAAQACLSTSLTPLTVEEMRRVLAITPMTPEEYVAFGPSKKVRKKVP